MMSIPECPPLTSLPTTNTSDITPEINFSSKERYIGTEISVTCPEDYYIVGHEIITCLDTLRWDAEQLPHCTDVRYGIPDSTKLYIAVFSTCAMLVLLGFAVVIAKIACRNRKYDRDVYMKSTISVASMEYFPSQDKRYKLDVTVPEADAISATFKTDTDDEHSDVMERYRDHIIEFQNNAIEHNFETFINPSFCDDESTRERWQQRMRGYDVDDGSVSRELYESHVSGYESSFDDESYCQIGDNQSQESNERWSEESINALEGYDYERYSRIPRAKSPNGNPPDNPFSLFS